MAKSFKQTTSEDALTIHVRGDKRHPEPTHLIIKFGGGHIELARCSNGDYWVHLTGNDSSNVVDSRIEYDHDGYLKNGITKIKDADQVKKLAMCFHGKIADEEFY